MKFENRITCDYCKKALPAENDDPTEKVIAVLVVHRPVCSSTAWPPVLREVTSNEYKAHLIVSIHHQKRSTT